MTSVIVKKDDLAKFIKALMVKAGSSENDANHLAEVLVDADYRFAEMI